MTKRVQLQDRTLLNTKEELIEKLNNETNVNELSKGLVFLLKEYYVGKFDVCNDEIFVRFDNNQKFCISIKQLN